MTAYRSSLERVKRAQWKTYLRAGEKRYKFQKYLTKHRLYRTTRPKLYKYRKTQYKKWKDEALQEWKVLEKLHLGVRILDATIHLNFRMERLLYEKKLGGRFRD